METTKSQPIEHFDDSTQDAIRSQLSRILSSPLFRDSSAPSRFLSFVVNAVLSGRKLYIKQYTIAVEAFGYPAEFDPHTSATIRVLAIRLRSMLEKYYREEGANDDILIEIPKRTYIPVFRSNSKQQPDDHPKSSTTPLPDTTPGYSLSIAVLPFANFPPDDKNLWAANITESIATGLAQFRELNIFGPLMKYKDRTVDAGEVGRRYRVRFVLQGRIQTYDDIIKISAGLTDTRTISKIWTQTYEYTQTATNLFDIEDNVTRRIVSALADYSGIIPSLISRESMKKQHDSLNGYEAVCSQMYYLKVFTMNMHTAAVEALEHTIKSEAENSIALAMLSHAYCIDYMFDLGLAFTPLEDAERLARRARICDHECQMAFLSEALVRFLQRQADKCLPHLRTAISLNPLNAFVTHSAGFMFCMSGHWDEGMRLWEQAIHLNPNLPPIYFIVPFINHYRRGDYEAAWNLAENFNTPIYWDPLGRAAAAGQMGYHTQAKVALEELLEIRPDFPSRARDLMSRVVYLEEHVKILLDGLRKAGLQLK